MTLNEALTNFRAYGGPIAVGIVPDDVRTATLELLEAASDSAVPAVRECAERAFLAMTELRRSLELYSSQMRNGADDRWMFVVLRANTRLHANTTELNSALRDLVLAVEPPPTALTPRSAEAAV